MYPYLNIHAGIEHLLQAFSWMLVHSLWQGLLLAVITAILLQSAKRAKAQLRYSIVFIQFILFIVACIWTFIHGLGAPPETMVPLAGAIGQNASQLLNLDAVNVRQFANSCAGYISDHASMLVLVWSVFFTFRSFRMVQGLIYLQKTRNTHTHGLADWNERLFLLCRKLHIDRHIRLLESARVKVPMVIGHLKPVILMPAGLLTGLPVKQIEAVLLHELAHIRRHDYLVNLVQTICETVYFFNPGLLWISALLRDEREHCCDDIALGQTGNKKEFIQALISFKEHAMYNYPSAVAFPGKKNQLLQRVSRIINNKNQSLGTGEKVFFLAGIILLAAILSTAAITQLREIEQDIFSGKHTADVYYYTPPVEQQLSAVIREDKPSVQPAERITERKHQQTKNSMSTSTAVSETIAQPMEVTTTDLDEEHDANKPQKNNPRREQAEDYSHASGEIPNRSQPQFYTGQRRQPVIRKPYHPEDYPRLNRLTTSLTVVNETEEQRATHEARERQNEDAREARIQSERDRQQSIRDKEQADRDRIQAGKDKEQALRDRAQAERDREQAVRDRIQADRDREQAGKDRIQAEKDRQQAILDRLQADKDRAQADADKRRQTQFPVI
jgi:beta-lactamase regulating signal transducer with metallopeptidase domain